MSSLKWQSMVLQTIMESWQEAAATERSNTNDGEISESLNHFRYILTIYQLHLSIICYLIQLVHLQLGQPSQGLPQQQRTTWEAISTWCQPPGSRWTCCHCVTTWWISVKSVLLSLCAHSKFSFDLNCAIFDSHISRPNIISIIA